MRGGLITIALVCAAPWLSAPGGSDAWASLHAAGASASPTDTLVFDGRTPCGPLANEFTGFPSANCEKIKWEVTLYRERASGKPAGYRYRGTRTEHTGAWTIRRGRPRDADAVVYQLAHRKGVLSLLSIDDRVLLLLDRDLAVVPGDAGWSYALNRMNLP